MGDGNDKYIALKDSLVAVCHFKREHPRYNYLEWGTSKTDKESLAHECGSRLKDLKIHLTDFLKDIKIRGARIKECKGASFFPRQPWVGIFFKDETPTNGVYPIVFFPEDGSGFVVGCTESLRVGQIDFSQKYCELGGSVEELQEYDKVRQFMDGHLALGAKWFSADDFSIEEFTTAILHAVDIWRKYREEHPISTFSHIVQNRPVDILGQINGDLVDLVFEILKVCVGNQGWMLSTDRRSILDRWAKDGRTFIDEFFRWKDETGRGVGNFAQPQDIWLAGKRVIERWVRERDRQIGWVGEQDELRRQEDWYVQEEYDNVMDWLRVIDRLCREDKEDDSQLWVFRGQGDAEWKMETGLGLKADVGRPGRVDLEKILAYEHETMGAFKKEVSKNPEYCNFSGVDLLALMQHYGSKTRLLDFSLSPLVALYMALDQRDNYICQSRVYNMYHGQQKGDFTSDVAVWAIDVKQFAYPGFFQDLDFGFENDDDKVFESDDPIREWKKAPAGERVPWWVAKEKFHQDATRVLCAEHSKDLKEGIDVVFPRMNSERISAQEGLFLMPRMMNRTFHDNLKAALVRGSKGGCLRMKKYVFQEKRVEKIRQQLNDICITSKMIYPDLIGLAQSLNKKTNFRK